MGLSMPCASIFSSDSSIGDLLRNAASRQSRDRPCLQLLSVRLVDRAEKRLGALLLRIAEQLVGAALLMDAPFVEEAYAVGELACESHLVGHHQHGQAMCIAEPANHVEHFPTQFRVERRG